MTKLSGKTGGRQHEAAKRETVKRLFGELLDELLAHEGYGQLELFVRILNRGQREVIVRCGKEYRFVLDSGKA